MYKKPLFVIFVLILCTLGCSLSSNRAGEFAPTEVGTPEGPNVTKDIGSAGGTLASPDGRLTLTVPQNALTKTLPFSIQPITNKAGNGLGLAYRLEPNGKTFTTPLEISVRYDEKDLEGTVPEALSIAYQDKEGAWHAQKSARLDQAATTLTISTTHFTDFAILAGIQISPVKATVYVNEEIHVHLIQCKEPGFWGRLFSRRLDCSPAPRGSDSWVLRGPGRINYEWAKGVGYMAPAKKPTPNRAVVEVTIDFNLRNQNTGESFTERRTFSTKITIIDRGYRATGSTADLTYSGVICDLEKPFTVSGSVIGYKFQFTPSSATAGTVTITAAGMSVKAQGGGTYTIEGADTDRPRIAMKANVVGHSPVGSRTGSGTVYIDLVPLEKGECN